MPFKNATDRNRYMREYYRQNAGYFKAKSQRYRQELRELVRSLKLQCERCGFDKSPVALDFHHRDELQKEFSLATAYLRSGRKRILAEVAKCEVLCANCHRIEHYQP